MPLRAIIDGVEQLAPLIGPGDWDALRDRVRLKVADLRLPCCGATGHLRVSKNGIKHFVHARTANCSWGPETEWHCLAKSDIVRGCEDAGWDARTEVDGNGWRADVLASRAGVRIAFETQWSPQTADETRQRQSRYEADGVRCCWFFRKPPAAFVKQPQLAVPVFGILHDAGAKQLSIRHLERVYPLRDFAHAMLAHRLRFCGRISLAASQRMKVVFYNVRCYRCGFDGHDYRVEEGFRTPCGIAGGYIDESVEASGLQFEPQIVIAVQDFLRTDAVRGLCVGAIKPRYSSVREVQYMSVGCARCDSIFGDHYKAENFFEAENSRTGPPLTFEFNIACGNHRTTKHPHWCFPLDGKFCGDFGGG